MNWFYFAMFSSLATAIANILNKVLMKNDKSDALLSAILFQFTITSFYFIITVFTGFIMPPIMKYPVNFLLAGFFYGMGTYCIFQAYKYIESSEATIISSSVVLVTIFSAIIFLNEKLSFINIIGILLIITAVIGVSLKKKINNISINRKGVYYALGMAIFYGLGATNDAYLIRYVEPISYLVINSFLPGLFLLLISFRSIKKINYYFKINNVSKLLVFSFFYVLSGIGFYTALSRGAQVSQLSTITKSSVVITVILAAIFLKEKDRIWQKILFGLLVILGVFLMR